MSILSQFLLRLAFGLALGMIITSPKQVSSGYFRNNLYVTLGLTTLAALVISSQWQMAAGLAGIAALLSFFGAASWLYESHRRGIILTGGVALFSLLAACALVGGYHDVTALGTSQLDVDSQNTITFSAMISVVASGLVLGITFAAMLLGHWYLNSPGMELAPLRRLIAAAAAAVALQALLSGAGLSLQLATTGGIASPPFVLLRWCFGIVGVAALLWMARETLKIPNTQSATGILYVAVIGVFVGELAGLLLSVDSPFPL